MFPFARCNKSDEMIKPSKNEEHSKRTCSYENYVEVTDIRNRCGGKQVLKLGNPRNEGFAIPLFFSCMHLSGFQITIVPVHFNTECTGQTF
jgi:hypothetical protein